MLLAPLRPRQSWAIGNAQPTRLAVAAFLSGCIKGSHEFCSFPINSVHDTMCCTVGSIFITKSAGRSRKAGPGHILHQHKTQCRNSMRGVSLKPSKAQHAASLSARLDCAMTAPTRNTASASAGMVLHVAKCQLHVGQHPCGVQSLFKAKDGSNSCMDDRFNIISVSNREFHGT